MASFHPYLNFDGETEAAFKLYTSVFGGEPQFNYFRDMPDGDKLPEAEQNRVMHVSLPLSGGTVLMASDISPTMGQTLQKGNNCYISINADSKEEADRLYKGLSEGGEIEMEIQDTFWGAYFGSFSDRYGVKWMINFDHGGHPG